MLELFESLRKSTWWVAAVAFIVLGLDVAQAAEVEGSDTWSFRLRSGGGLEFEGLLQVLPPHETEWGTVCGNAGAMDMLLRRGSSESAALAAFFSKQNAMVACQSAGFPAASPQVFRMSEEEGWGSGPSYMSLVDCATKSTMIVPSLDECFFKWSLAHSTATGAMPSDCGRHADVYLRCGNSTLQQDNRAADQLHALGEAEDAAAQRHHALTLASLDSAPSAVVVVVLPTTSAATLKTAIANNLGITESRVSLANATTANVLSNATYFYFTLTFSNASSSSTGSAAGDSTVAPSSTGAYAMSQFVAKSSAARLNLGIKELREVASAYGTFSTEPLAAVTFSLVTPPNGDIFTNLTLTNAGYIMGTTSSNGDAGNICDINATVRDRVVAASYVCAQLGLDTIPSLLIPNFGNNNAGGFMMLSRLQILDNKGNFWKIVSPYYTKQNTCSNSDAYGILCGQGTITAQLSADPDSPRPYSYGNTARFCVTGTLWGMTMINAIRTLAYQQLYIAPYRIVYNGTSGADTCFTIACSYAFKDNTTNVDFDRLDIQFIFLSLNAAGWQSLLGVSLKSVSYTSSSASDCTATQQVLLTIDAFYNISGETLAAFFRSAYNLDTEDVTVVSDQYTGSMTLAPTAAPTAAPPITRAPKRYYNNSNRTRSRSLEVTVTTGISLTVTLSKEATETFTNRSGATNAPTTNSDTPIPAATTAAPAVVPLCHTQTRKIVLSFMFADPANQAYDLIAAGGVLGNGFVCNSGLPFYVTPPPPPPDYRPLIAGLSVAGLVFLTICVLAALVIKRVYYTRTSKRWDDDYVMMNMQVLTVPLATVDLATPKRRSNRKWADNTGDRDTSELF